MKPLIGLIDDDELFRLGLAEDLRSLGQPVELAKDAKGGLALLETKPLAAIIVDILMPKVDGLEFIVRIRQRWPDLYIIAISGGGKIGSEFYLGLAADSGADACLKKPVSGRDILAQIPSL